MRRFMLFAALFGGLTLGAAGISPAQAGFGIYLGNPYGSWRTYGYGVPYGYNYSWYRGPSYGYGYAPQYSYRYNYNYAPGYYGPSYYGPSSYGSYYPSYFGW